MANPLALQIMQNFTAFTTFFAPYDTAINVSHTADYVRTDTGINAGALNINVPLCDTPGEAAFEATLGHFTQQRRAAVMWVWDHLANWRAYLKECKVNLLGPNTGMCANIADLKLVKHKLDNLDIAIVTQPEQICHFGQVVAQAFGKAYEAPATEAYYDRLSRTEFYHDERLKMFVGYFNGQPVCTGTRLIEGGIAGIYSIAALPAMRGRGLG